MLGYDLFSTSQGKNLWLWSITHLITSLNDFQNLSSENQTAHIRCRLSLSFEAFYFSTRRNLIHQIRFLEKVGNFFALTIDEVLDRICPLIDELVDALPCACAHSFSRWCIFRWSICQQTDSEFYFRNQKLNIQIYSNLWVQYVYHINLFKFLNSYKFTTPSDDK